METLSGKVIKLTVFGKIAVGHIQTSEKIELVGMLISDFPNTYQELIGFPKNTHIILTGERLHSTTKNTDSFRIYSWSKI